MLIPTKFRLSHSQGVWKQKSTAKSLRGAFGKNSMNKCGIMLLLVDTISNLYIQRLRSL